MGKSLYQKSDGSWHKEPETSSFIFWTVILIALLAAAFFIFNCSPHKLIKPVPGWNDAEVQ